MEATEAHPTIEELIHQYHHPIFKYCYHMLRHKQDAEDAAQEVFVKAMRHAQDPGDIQSLSAWLYRVAHNHCLNMVKRKQFLRFIPFTSERNQQRAEESPGDQMESTMAIEHLLSILSPLDRSILLLKVLEDRSHEEIGPIVNLSPAAVRKRFERAKVKIKKACQQGKGESEHEQANVSFVSRV